ncbi:MAG TPA: efflux RND transporter periplasmic adaptor subunit [Daejeonella sp.]|nr:efflux RND transporter periplasmic adaptor subunit [Daejeonella sp.]
MIFSSCSQGEKKADAVHEHHYEAPKADTNLNYLLKPVNEQVLSRVPVIRAQKGSHIIIAQVQGRVTYDTRNETSLASRVGGRIERLYIKYNYQPVKKGQLIMEIYSPDLAAAQRELLFISRQGNEENMLQAAKQRLLLLGMSAEQINKVLKTGQVSYRIPVYSNASGYILEKTAASATASANTMASVNSSADGMGMGETAAVNASSAPVPASQPVLLREGQYVGAGQSIFTIYRSGDLVAEFALKPDQAGGLAGSKNTKVIIEKIGNKEESYTGTIGLIQPVFNAGENFTQARVYLKNTGLSVGELVLGHLPLIADQGYWLPKEALVSLGNQSVIFKKEGRVFVPKKVSTGISTQDKIQVLDDISNWEIASNAYYLVDSESFIKVNKE